MTNVNPINGVPFGQEKTREDFLARAAWEYDQTSLLRARKPVGYMALVEGHERAAKAYEREAEGRPSRRAHATIAAPTKGKRGAKTRHVYVVQGNYGYGHGWEDLTAEEDGNEARARIREYRENERGVPFRLIRRREKIDAATTPTHARKKKIDPREAKQRLKAAGIDFSRDFHELRLSDVDEVLAVARAAGYRKRKDAPGSTARMYFQYLRRQP